MEQRTDYAYDRRNNAGCGRFLGNFLMLALGGLIVLLLAGMFPFWRAGERVFDGFDTMFNGPTPTPQVDVRGVVLEQVKLVSELNTVTQRYSAVIPVVQEGTVLLVVPTQTKLLYVAVGDVQAGIDLSQITNESIREEGDTIYIQLPPPQIMDVSLDPRESLVYDYDRGILNLGPDAPNLQREAELKGEAELLHYACRSGIMEDANRQAVTVVEALVSVATEREVVVESQPAAAGSCPTE